MWLLVTFYEKVSRCVKLLFLEVIQSSGDELGDQVAGVFPVSATSLEDHLVDCETTVDLEVEDGFRVGFVQIFVRHQFTYITGLTEFRDPVDDDRFERIVEEHDSQLAVLVDLVTESVRAKTVLLIGGFADVVRIVDLHRKDLIDEFGEHVHGVAVVDVERGTVDVYAFTEFLDGYSGEWHVSHHLEERLLDGGLRVDGALVRLALRSVNCIHFIPACPHLPPPP